ncbi:c-type cytochrome [Roseococcus sp. YIM B11640]|uniref:c-type cytochrome n=1 Tax=Roseococcus sp. YIM B11640 TaxID=3133973 RepID=UPI003C7AC653
MRIGLLLEYLRDEAADLARHLWLNRALVFGMATAAVLAAGLTIWSGIYDVAASKGHWRPVGAILNYGMRQSIATHSTGHRPPPLDDAALVRRGAGHFQGGCAPCHGAPGRPPNPVTRRMVPAPPELAPHIADWQTQELFQLVMHGIKYTGMPAWPAAARPDEAWAVVAFLRSLPGLDEAAYRELAFGEMAPERAQAASDAGLLLRNGPLDEGIAGCGRCHGRSGQGDAEGAFPRLAGQSEAYLLDALRAFADGSRPSGIMGPVAAELTPPEMAALARHYASQPTPAAMHLESERLERGREIATTGLPGRGVAACGSCHDGGNPRYPRLAGQHHRYLQEQLTLWMQGVRTGDGASDLAWLMGRAVGGRYGPDEGLWPLSPEDIRAVAAWYASQENVP